MSGVGDADGIPPASVPGPRRARLPLPPAAVPAGPHDGDITDGLEEAYWSVYDGAAAKATVRQLLARLPRIVRRIGRLAWSTDRPATLAVVLLQLASAAMTAFGLMASVAVLRELFAEGPTPDRVRAAAPLSFRGPARGPLASGLGMTVAPCLLDDLGGCHRARGVPSERPARSRAQAT
ncbi:hypothetical protein [Streptomyces californicus]|uniref:hypothetical protein n=1 Tax=Streptomyces californicus TaxID=67351 RepID=UPI0037BAAC6B